MQKRIPVGRLGMPEEIAATVELMVLNGYLTNKVLKHTAYEFVNDGTNFPRSFQLMEDGSHETENAKS